MTTIDLHQDYLGEPDDPIEDGYIQVIYRSWGDNSIKSINSKTQRINLRRDGVYFQVTGVSAVMVPWHLVCEVTEYGRYEIRGSTSP